MTQQTDKEKQKKLLTEIMNDDAQDGLYDHVPDKKVTAVEWLLENLCYVHRNGAISINIHPDSDITDIIKQAKAMEKEQKIEFANEYADAVMGGCIKRAEQYYNEKYNK